MGKLGKSGRLLYLTCLAGLALFYFAYAGLLAVYLIPLGVWLKDGAHWLLIDSLIVGIFLATAGLLLGLARYKVESRAVMLVTLLSAVYTPFWTMNTILLKPDGNLGFVVVYLSSALGVMVAVMTAWRMRRPDKGIIPVTGRQW